MKLYGELAARTILGQHPFTYNHRIIRPEFVHLSTAHPLNDLTTSVANSAVGGVPGLLGFNKPIPPTLDLQELRM